MSEVVAGRYRLVREVGRGASGTVYLAYDQTLERDVALKLVAPALANDPSFVDRFLREARLSAALSHPHVATVHDVGETEDHRPFLTMAFVDGASLETVIAKSAPLPLGEATRILTELASALDYLHGQGLVHRDVKPSNVLIEDSGRVMLSDFGIAYARESARYTMTGVLLGTPRYMAPEQMLGEEPTAQTDVYAMGVVAFEMLAGAPPFEGTGTGLMYKIVHEAPPPVTAVVPGIPAGVEAAIARALQKDPSARWDTPGEFAAAVASPEANATLVGRSSGVPLPPQSATATVPAEPAGTSASPADGGVPPGDGAAAASAGDGSGGGRRRALLGAGGVALVGLAGLAVAAYCLAGGGVNSPGDAPAGRIDRTPGTATVSAADESPTPTVRASLTGPGTASPSATPYVSPIAGVQPTSRPPVTPVYTNTSAASPTTASTAAATATPTPSPTQSPSPTPTATATPAPTLAPPGAPSNVALTGNTLSWNDNSGNETGFRIYWRTTGLNDGVTHVTNDKSVGPNTTSTSVDTIYYTFDQTDFRRGVSAYNSAGESTIAWNK